MRLLFAGTPDVAVPSLKALLDSSHQVVAVLTRPDAPVGRGHKMMGSPVKDVAREHGIEVLTPSRPSDLDFIARLEKLGVDCAPIVAYGGLIPSRALTIPRFGWVNLHFSLLPAWRGAAPVQHALLAGDDITGASTFQLEEGLDTGPVFGTITEPIKDSDTSGELLERLALSGADLLVRTLDGIESGAILAAPQSRDGVSHAPKLLPIDGYIDFSTPALAVHRRIRACTPSPGAWTELSGERIKLFPMQMRTDIADIDAGYVRLTKHEVLVGTASHALAMGDVQPAGKKRMSSLDWARGLRLQDGPLFV